jgi:medium-chain acyl-[acyl-carrier-protein] hydrolase
LPHREPFRVRSYEVDVRERLTMRALCGYLQEAAGIHAALLGASMARLRESGLAWVLHRLRLEVEECPRQGEALEVVTWPSRFDRVVADREFEVFDERGRRVAAATSRWAVADLRLRRPVRMPEFILQIGGEQRPAPLTLGRTELPAVSQPATLKTFAVRRSDLDVVRHVNNTQYVDWLLETVPDEVEGELRPAALELVFQREALYGDVVRSETQPIPADRGQAFAHVLRHGDAGHELVRAVSFWV